MNCLCSSETFLTTPLLISPDLDGRSVFFWDIPINTTTDFTWSTRWTVFVLLRHCYQHHYWSHLIYKTDCLFTFETFLLSPLLISSDLQDGLFLYFWDIHINTTTDLTWSTIWTVFVLLRHFYQHHYWSHLIYNMDGLCTSETFLSTHYWSHLIYKMNCFCSSETFLSTPLLISPDLQDGLSLYFWDIHINTTTDLTWSTIWTSLYFWDISINTLLISPDLQDELSLYFWGIPINTTTDLIWSTRWIFFVLLRHSYQHHYSSHLIYKMDCLCTSETFISTPLLISPDLQYGRSLYFWDISINTTTDLTWSTRWTVFVLLRHSYQHHYWSHLIYNMDVFVLQRHFYQHTTDLTWSTRWTVFVILRHSYQHHYWSHLIYKMNFLCTSETFLSTPLLISPDLQDGLSLYFWDIHINTTTDLTWSTRWTGFVLLRHCYQYHYWSHLIYKIDCLCTSEKFLSTPPLISPDLQDWLSLYFWDIYNLTPGVQDREISDTLG